MSTSLPRRAAALVACLACLGPARLLAAPPDQDGDADAEVDPDAEDTGEDEPEDDSLSQASDMFYAGVTRYNAADYEGAIELWLAAYDLVEPTFDNRLIKAELIYNVARAQQQWFEIDDDVEHLRRSRAILQRFFGELDELYGDQSGLERDKVEEQIANVEQAITAWEEEQARREAELAERMRPKFDFEADAREAKRNKAMIGAGAGLTAIGLAGVGMLVTGIVLAGSATEASTDLHLADDIPMREDVIFRGELGNGLLVTGSLAAGVFLTAGVPLLAAGGSAENKRKQRRANAGVDDGAARIEAVSPVWVRGGFGLGLSGRF